MLEIKSDLIRIRTGGNSEHRPLTHYMPVSGGSGSPRRTNNAPMSASSQLNRTNILYRRDVREAAFVSSLRASFAL